MTAAIDPDPKSIASLEADTPILVRAFHCLHESIDAMRPLQGEACSLSQLRQAFG